MGKDCLETFIEIPKIMEFLRVTWYHNNHNNTDAFLFVCCIIDPVSLDI